MSVPRPRKPRPPVAVRPSFAAQDSSPAFPGFSPQAAAKIAKGRRLIDEGLALLAGDVVDGESFARVERRMTRPAGESDEVAAAKARRILREKGFVPR
jgi:hypothetical protein